MLFIATYGGYTMSKDLDKKIIDEDVSVPNTQKSGFVNGNKASFDDIDEVEAVVPKKKADSKAGLIIIFVVFLAVNIIAILFFVLDVGHIRTRFVAYQNNSMISAADSALKAKLVADRKLLEDEKSQLEAEKALIAETDTKQKQKEEELNKMTKEFEDKQIAEQEIAANAAANIQPVAATEDSKIAEIVKIYESMEPKSVAKILLSLDMSERVAIIKRIKKAVAAEILSAMDSTQSANITKELMKN